MTRPPRRSPLFPYPTLSRPPPALVSVERGPANPRVRVAIDEAGEQAPRHFHRVDCGLRNAECGMEVASFGARTDPDDSLAFDEHGGVVEDFNLRHLPAPASPRRAATRDDLPRANEQGAQSPAPPSCIGSRIP